MSTATTQRPLLLLDIDGVSNVHPYKRVGHDLIAGRRQWVRKPLPEGFAEAHAEGHDLTYNLLLPEWIAAFEDVFEPVHATMWEHKAGSAYHAFGIPSAAEWDYIVFSDERDRYERTWKMQGVKDRIGDRPAIFVDDLITPHHVRWAQTRTDVWGIPTMCLKTDEDTGLTADDVRLILGFAQRAQEWLDEQALVA